MAAPLDLAALAALVAIALVVAVVAELVVAELIVVAVVDVLAVSSAAVLVVLALVADLVVAELAPHAPLDLVAAVVAEHVTRAPARPGALVVAMRWSPSSPRSWWPRRSTAPCSWWRWWRCRRPQLAAVAVLVADRGRGDVGRHRAGGRTARPRRARRGERQWWCAGAAPLDLDELAARASPARPQWRSGSRWRWSSCSRPRDAR